MVFFNEKKYACLTCIKGHRSSGCQHTDRPLIEIKKKGRPVTQCEHCRELRKTRQVHVKCQCDNSKEDTSLPFGIPGARKALAPSSLEPAFPNGIVPATPATVPSDSLPPIPPCGCHSTDECKCWSPLSTKRRSLSSMSSFSSLASHPPASSTLSPVPTSAIENTNAALASTSPSTKAQLSTTVPTPMDLYHNHPASTAPEPQHRSPFQVNFEVPPPTSGAYETPSLGSHFAYAPPQDQGWPYSPPSISQQQPSVPSTPVEYYSNWSSQAPAAPGPGQCACGATCSCPGCADHGSGYDRGSGTASTFCTPGCTNGSGCGNSINSPPPSQTVYAHARRPSLNDDLASVASFTTFSSSGHSHSLSQDSTNANYWISGPSTPATTEEGSTTGFATSREREAQESGPCSPTHSPHPHYGVHSQPPASPYATSSISASTSSFHLPAASTLSIASLPNPSLAHSLHIQGTARRHQSHSHLALPSGYAYRNRSSLSLAASQPATQKTPASLVKKSFKRLLPKPIDELSASADGVLEVDGNGLYKPVEEVARAPPPTMTFNYMSRF